MKLIFKDRNYFILLVIFSAAFFGITFASVKDVAFMGVDAQLITRAIHDLFDPPYYNMMASYHSRLYGWTHMVISAIALAPLKLLFGVENPQITNYCVKLVLFLISLLAVFVFYRLAVQSASKTR